MELFNPYSKINFMGFRLWAAAFSLLLFLFSIGSLGFYGLNWGLDFVGGTQLEVDFPKPVDLTQIRKALAQVGLNEAVVQAYGSAQTVQISLAHRSDRSDRSDKEQAEQLKSVMAALPKGAEQKRVDYIGAQVGKEMAEKGFLAVLMALLGIMIYIAVRFQYRLAISASVALIHDPIVILGVFAFFGLEFDLKVLSAILAMIGYSLNDTIVVFDRVRENFKRMRQDSPTSVMNASINQTLSRTIMTSWLTLVVVLALFIYGGETIRGFSLALIIGIVIGTYSSIYIAGALAVFLGLSRYDFLKTTRGKTDLNPMNLNPINHRPK